MYYTYMLRCEDNSIYTGITTNIERRIKEHISKGKKSATGKSLDVGAYALTEAVIVLESIITARIRATTFVIFFIVNKLLFQNKFGYFSDWYYITTYFSFQQNCILLNIFGILTNSAPYHLHILTKTL